jgi:hypothetical protein
MGLFAQWQPEYARRGIATFPVRIEGKDKKPAVSDYLKLDARTSQQLVRRFGGYQAFGLALRPSRITVLDVDTTDERVLADAMDRHGRSPFIVRSISGHYQAWYRHNGERRRVRPWGADLQIDVLGDGFVVAPPSRAAHGEYQIIEGTLDDLEQLPSLQDLSLPSQNTPSKTTPDCIGVGHRNDTLFRFCMKKAHECGSKSQLLKAARSYVDETFKPKLSDAEISRTVDSAWGYTERGENRFGAGRRVQFEHEEVDALAGEHPDAFALLGLLRRHHWNREFVVANALAKTLGPKGWRRQRFAAARQVLEQQGRIIMIRAPAKDRGPALYRWPDRVDDSGQQ